MVQLLSVMEVVQTAVSNWREASQETEEVAGAARKYSAGVARPADLMSLRVFLQKRALNVTA